MSLLCALTHFDKEKCQYCPVIISLQYSQIWGFPNVFIYVTEYSLSSLSLSVSDKDTNPWEIAGGGCGKEIQGEREWYLR